MFLGFKPVILLIEYTYFNDSFTANYCINQSEPALQCHGACHLKKVVSEKDGFDTTKEKISLTQIVLFQNVCNLSITYFEHHKKRKINRKTATFPSIALAGIEHPPQNLI